MTQKELQAIQFLHWLNNPWILSLFIALSIWALIWKGIALWKASRNNHKIWFIILLVANTVGILEIIYIFFFSKKREKA
jgi:methionyl-tRNA synthetase